MKHNLNLVRDSLPNGYCGRPAQQDCPHPNACLTCPDFQTTPEFLEIHLRQASSNRRLIAQADAKGQLRLGENLRHVQANLERIIPALEALENGGPDNDAGDNSSFLVQANARRHEATFAAADDAIEQLGREGRAVSFGAVAHTAGVSRTWLIATRRSETSSAGCVPRVRRPRCAPHNNVQAPTRFANDSTPPEPRSLGYERKTTPCVISSLVISAFDELRPTTTR